jgi:hypothetical protein
VAAVADAPVFDAALLLRSWWQPHMVLTGVPTGSESNGSPKGCTVPSSRG